MWRGQSLATLHPIMKILFIEDDPVIAEFVQKGLKEAGFVVSHVSDGQEGLDLGLVETFEAGIFDVMLPSLSGLEIIERLRKKGVNLPIIILSARTSLDDRINGLHQGGDDYLTKPFSISELIARVQSLLRRASRVVEATELVVHDLKIDLLSRAATRAGRRIDLQPKEFSLLEYLMRNHKKVISKSMMIERVWDYHFDPHTNVVEARMSRLREKIDKGFDESLIHTVRGLGYVLKRKNEE